MNPHISQLLADGAPPQEAVDAFLRDHAFPLVEPGNVTFIFRGVADEVILRRWISGFNTALPMQLLEGTDLWVLTMDLPQGSRFEYKFEVVKNGGRELMLDALNDVVAQDPFGANSVCQGYGYKRPAWTLPDPDARAGSLVHLPLQSDVFGGRRDVEVYLPARFKRRRSYPLLVVHDGPDYLRYADVKTVLDNRIHRREIPAMILLRNCPVPFSPSATRGK